MAEKPYFTKGQEVMISKPGQQPRSKAYCCDEATAVLICELLNQNWILLTAKDPAQALLDMIQGARKNG